MINAPSAVHHSRDAGEILDPRRPWRSLRNPPRSIQKLSFSESDSTSTVAFSLALRRAATPDNPDGRYSSRWLRASRADKKTREWMRATVVAMVVQETTRGGGKWGTCIEAEHNTAQFINTLGLV